MKLLSFSGSDLAAFLNHFCLQPSDMASVSQDSDSFFASEMQVLLDVVHLYCKVLVVIDCLFIFFYCTGCTTNRPRFLFTLNAIAAFTTQAFLIIFPPLPQAFQDFKCFLFICHTSQTLDFMINAVRGVEIQTFPIEKSLM